MRILDLGHLLVDSGEVSRPCSGPKQAAILTTLAMRAGDRVPVEDLIVAGWGYDATVTTSSLENHLWRLRQLLEPDRPRAAAGRSCLVNDSGGYRLAVEPADVDSLHFAHLAARARDAEEADPDQVVAVCERALSLWRGAPHEATAHVVTTAAAVARLEELRGQLLERRLRALIALGDLEAVLVELEPLLAAYPYRERLRGLQMTALARTGRVEEALAVFTRVRTLLRDELGVEPGAELQQLQREVLARERHTRTGPVGATTRITEVPRRAAPAVAHLPERAGALIGRDREIDDLARVLARSSLTTVVGPGGCGKTRLAIAVARRTIERFPDGIWFVDLTELSTASGLPAVAEGVATRLGLRPEGGDAAAAVQDFITDRRALVLLDNCEHVLDGAAGLLEGAVRQVPQATIVATSREPLAVEGEALWTLGPLSLSPRAVLDRSDAAVLFEARAASSPTAAQRQFVERICRALDGLPLAIELAAARTRSFSLEEIAAQVESDPAGLGRVGRGPTDHRATLRTAIDWSHQLLDPEERLAHRRLAVLPGAFTLPVAVAAVGPGIPISEVPTVLARLVHRSLLVSTASTRPGGRTTFRQLETIRAHALHALVEADEEAETLGRRDRWVQRLLASKPRLGRGEESDWYDVVEENYPTVRAALDTALVAPVDLDAINQGASLIWFWYYRSRVHEGARWLGRAATSVGDRPEAVIAHAALASALMLLVRLDEAGPPLQIALSGAPAVAPEQRERLIEVLAAIAGGAWTLERWDIARQVADCLERLVAPLDDLDLDLVVAGMACAAGLGAVGEHQALAARASAVHRRAIELDNVCATWVAGAVLNIVALLARDPVAGLRWTDEVIRSTRRLGAGGGGVYTEALANFLVMGGDLEEAVRLYASASAQNRRDGMMWPARTATREFLDRAQEQLPGDVHRRAWREGETLSFSDVVARRRAWETATPTGATTEESAEPRRKRGGSGPTDAPPDEAVPRWLVAAGGDDRPSADDHARPDHRGDRAANDEP